MIEKTSNIPMYFSTLEIENIKCFGEKQVLDLKDSNGVISPWTLILGDNGVGKTTLLKALAWMVPVEETDDEKKKEANISECALKPFMDDFELESEYEELVRVSPVTISRVGATLSLGVQLGQIPTEESLIHFSTRIETKEGKLHYMKSDLASVREFVSPSIYAYSAGRHMEPEHSDVTALQNPTYNLFSETGALYDAEKLLTMLDTASLRQNGKGKASELFRKVKNILADLLPYVESPDSIIVNSPINEDGSINKRLVEIQTPDGKIGLFDLSLGYKTMLSWIVDLAVRMMWRNPDCDEPLSETSIVLVDEIDLHLHPKWQRMVRDVLTKNFPCTQFICTAHSPFMAQAAELENLCVVKREYGRVVIMNDPFIIRGWRIGQIITSDLFDIETERSPSIEAKVLERRDLLDKQIRTSADNKRLTELNIELDRILDTEDTESDEDRRIMDQIKHAAQVLKEKGLLK